MPLAHILQSWQPEMSLDTTKCHPEGQNCPQWRTTELRQPNSCSAWVEWILCGKCRRVWVPGQADRGPSRGCMRNREARGRRDRENISPRNSQIWWVGLWSFTSCGLWGQGVCLMSALRSQSQIRSHLPWIRSGLSCRWQKSLPVPVTCQSVTLSFQL